uniref:Uncharacterized protein n=1 Tax=viral metagenome TaxID=1070528 RepID=A0A6C0LYU5_9ZZZZ
MRYVVDWATNDPLIRRILMPYGIGCGYGGGVWSDYYSAIIAMANKTSVSMGCVRTDKLRLTLRCGILHTSKVCSIPQRNVNL